MRRADVTFLRDVAPILNKVGCTSGPCHGAAKGKNGFKLSLRGYDPQFDYEALLYDLSGRRFNRADPGRSLMLAKPTQQVAARRRTALRNRLRLLQDHLRLDRAGRAVRRSGEGHASRGSKSSRKEIFMKAPGETAAVKVTRDYADGGTRDVTKLAVVESNMPDVADRDGRRGDGARVAKPRCWCATRAISPRCR